MIGSDYMFDDISVFKDNKRINYTYEVKDNKLLVKIDTNSNYEKIEVVIDYNVYENISFKNGVKVTTEDSRLFEINDYYKYISFDISIKSNYLVKVVFDFINRHINKNELLKELIVFKKCKNEYLKDINELVKEINKGPDLKEDSFIKEEEENIRIDNILIKNKLYTTLAEKMSLKELMLLITYYISSNKIPQIDDNTFNGLVKEAINSLYPLETVWRLAMNYDRRGYNYDDIDKFFIDSRDTWYIGEYISGVYHADLDKILKMIIDTKDKKFIKDVLNEPVITSYLGEEEIKLLEKELSS